MPSTEPIVCDREVHLPGLQSTRVQALRTCNDVFRIDIVHPSAFAEQFPLLVLQYAVSAGLGPVHHDFACLT